MPMNRVILGTVQLGLEYGIANRSGQPDKREAFDILQSALDLGIRCFDTAHGYGTSEEILGEFFLGHPISDLRLLTKLPALKESISDDRIRSLLNESLRRLRQPKVHCYMVHSAADLLSDRHNVLAATLLKLKKEGLIDAIGVSVYDEGEIRQLLGNVEFDVIQVPFNVFDQRLLHSGVLADLRRHGKEIHVRSVLLQGLIPMDDRYVPDKLKGIIPYKSKLSQAAHKVGLSVQEMALLFVNVRDEIDKIVIGVDNAMQLRQNAAIFKKLELQSRLAQEVDWSQFCVNDVQLIDPRQW